MSLTFILQLVLILFLLLAGGAMLAAALLALLWMLFRRWRVTTGAVTGVSIDQFTDTNNYTVTVSYIYQVDNREYEARFVAFDVQGEIAAQEAQKIARLYPTGKPLTIYYPAGRPQDPALERDTGDTIFFTLVLVPVGIVALLLAFGWLNGLIDQLNGV